jgi:phosphoglycerol transferase MdoB-like AlkP superfamily enzyme
MFKKSVLSVPLTLLSVFALSAQNAEMADSFRGEGKIYVVVGVMLILLIGLFVYLFSIERRVKKMEKE